MLNNSLTVDQIINAIEGIVLPKNDADKEFVEENDKYILKVSSYVELLLKWGRVHNVVSNNISGIDLWENVYDSVCLWLIINRVITSQMNPNNFVIDAGAGGGFPGIPLAILLHHTNFFLVDDNRKKCSFLRLVKAQLKLDNVQVINKKLENIEPSFLIVTRAAFSPRHLGILANALKVKGRVLLWSTPQKTFETVEAFKLHNVSLIEEHDYSLLSNKTRRLLIFERVG